MNYQHHSFNLEEHPQSPADEIRWLLQNCIDGDEDSIRRIVEIYAEDIREKTGQVFNNPELVDQITGDVLYRAMLSLKEGSGSLEFAGLIDRTLPSVLEEYVRKSSQDKIIFTIKTSDGIEPKQLLDRNQNLAEAVIGQVKKGKQFYFVDSKVKELFLLISVLGLIVIFAWWMQSQGRAEEKAYLTGVPSTQLVLVEVTRTAAPTRTQKPIDGIGYLVPKNSSLAQVSRDIGVPLKILSALNNLPIDAKVLAGQRIVVGVGNVPAALITPTLVTPATFLPPLSQDSTPEEIIGRMLRSRQLWHTIWVDAVVVNYGMPDYFGEPEIRREQIWLSKPNQLMIVSGKFGGKPDELYSVDHGAVLLREMPSGQEQMYFGEQMSPRSAVRPMLQSATEWSYSAGKQIKIIGEEEVAGRKCVMIEIYALPQNREAEEGKNVSLCIDAITGLILRERDYYGGDLLWQEIIIQKMALEINFNPDVLNPELLSGKYFVSDYTGEAESGEPGIAAPEITLRATPRVQVNPPLDFTPVGSKLEFLFSRADDLNNGNFYYSVFADNYYLGDLNVGRSIYLNCVRKPQSNEFLYIFHDPEYNSQLRIGNFNDLDNSRIMNSEITVWQITAPLSRNQIAFLGYTDELYAIYLYDWQKEETVKLLDIAYGYYLYWKPDGSQLAFIGRLPPGSDLSEGPGGAGDQLIVIDPISGDVIEAVNIPPFATSVPAESIVSHWAGVAILPPPNSGLSLTSANLCSEP